TPKPVESAQEPLDMPDVPESMPEPEGQTVAPAPTRLPSMTEASANGELGDDETLSGLELPDLEALPEEPEEKNDFSDEKEATHVDLGERPPEESADTAKKGEHPELRYNPPKVDGISR